MRNQNKFCFENKIDFCAQLKLDHRWDQWEKFAGKMVKSSKNRSFLCCGLIRTGKIIAIVDFLLTILTIGGLVYLLQVFADNKVLIKDQLIRLRNLSRSYGSEPTLNEQKKILEHQQFYNDNMYNGVCCALFFAALHLLFSVFFLFGISKVRSLSIIAFKSVEFQSSLQMSRQMTLPFAITSGITALLLTILTFFIPNVVALVVLKIYIFYVAVVIFMFTSQGGQEDDADTGSRDNAPSYNHALRSIPWKSFEFEARKLWNMFVFFSVNLWNIRPHKMDKIKKSESELFSLINNHSCAYWWTNCSVRSCRFLPQFGVLDEISQLRVLEQNMWIPNECKVDDCWQVMNNQTSQTQRSPENNSVRSVGILL